MNKFWRWILQQPARSILFGGSLHPHNVLCQYLPDFCHEHTSHRVFVMTWIGSWSYSCFSAIMMVIAVKTAHHRKIKSRMLTVIYFIIFAVQNVLSFCPDECSCNDQSLKASCIHTELEVTLFLFNSNLSDVWNIN